MSHHLKVLQPVLNLEWVSEWVWCHVWPRGLNLYIVWGDVLCVCRMYKRCTHRLNCVNVNNKTEALAWLDVFQCCIRERRPRDVLRLVEMYLFFLKTQSSAIYWGAAVLSVCNEKGRASERGSPLLVANDPEPSRGATGLIWPNEPVQRSVN